jgi:sugar phosphate isomerase/epimerase
VRFGFAGYSWPGLHGQPGELSLQCGAEAGLEVMQFLEPTALSPGLSATRLMEIRAEAQSLGLDLELGITHFELSGNRPTAVVFQKLQTCLAAGVTEISTLTKLDRFDPVEPMTGQLDRLTGALESLQPLLTAHGAHLNLETHEDLTSDEVARVIDRLDPTAIGVTMDVANFAVNAEDPIAATRRIAPRIRQTHLEDIRLHLVERGIRRITHPIGDGILDWSVLLGLLGELERPPTVCVELHRGQFDADVFDPQWIDCHPDLRAGELAGCLAEAVAGAIQRGDGVVDRGPWPTPVGAAPQAERVQAIVAGLKRLRGAAAVLA